MDHYSHIYAEYRQLLMKVKQVPDILWGYLHSEESGNNPRFAMLLFIGEDFQDEDEW